MYQEAVKPNSSGEVRNKEASPEEVLRLKAQLLRNNESLVNWDSEKFKNVKLFLKNYLGEEDFNRFDRIVKEGYEQTVAIWFVSQATYNRSVDTDPELKDFPEIKKQQKKLMEKAIGITFPESRGFGVYAYVRTDYSPFVIAMGTAHERLHMGEISRDADFSDPEELSKYKARTEARHRLQMKEFLEKLLSAGISNSDSKNVKVEDIMKKLVDDLRNPKLGKMKSEKSGDGKIWMPDKATIDFMHEFLQSKGFMSGPLQGLERGVIGHLCLVVANEPAVVKAHYEKEYEKGHL